MTAEERGYFADAGLKVEVFRPGMPYYTLKYVLEEIVDLGVTHQPQVAMAVSKGAPIVALGSLVPRPTGAMIWLRGSGIHSLHDLKGRTIAYPGLSFQEVFLEDLLRRHGLSPHDVTLKRAGYQLVPELASGRADAIFGGSRNFEGAQLETRRLDPVVTPASKLGIPSYDELVVIARRDFVRDNPQLIRSFMAAMASGTAAAIADPEGAVQTIRESPERDIHLSRDALEAQMEATLPLLSTSAYMPPAQARNLLDWMHRQGLIRSEPPVPRLISNAYLPEEGE